MKTFLLLTLSVAFVALFVLQVSLVVSMSLLFGAGFAAIVIVDYGPRRARPFTLARPSRAHAVSRDERLGLAA